jgi:hypothetical protein
MLRLAVFLQLLWSIIGASVGVLGIDWEETLETNEDTGSEYSEDGQQKCVVPGT